MASDVQSTALKLLTVFSLLSLLNAAFGEVLTPPYFNLAVKKHVSATSTCGYGVSEPELFCKLTGANRDNVRTEVLEDFELIRGQLCDYCYTSAHPGKEAKDHRAFHATDGTEQWWQSPPLSRGLEYNEVNLTIDLGQEYHVAYVFIKMANSPRPGVFALERSVDYGKTWKPWQYFADTVSDCHTFFGDAGYENKITSDNSVVCTTEFSSIVPLEGGEIVVSLVNDRPSSRNFSYSPTLQEWTKATGVRLRLLRTKTLFGHLMAKARQDPTVTRRYYYSIKDISIGGRCVCNGHADTCDLTDPNDPAKLKCRCRHNTCGDQCEKCCPGFVQKPWKPATLENVNECEPCNCHGHSETCYYDEEVALRHESLDIHGKYEGGGVCENCRDHTTGINCEKCVEGYYRPFDKSPSDRDACQPCQCDLTVSTGNCEDGTGRCECRPEYAGTNCDRCNDGYYGYPRCLPCDCNIVGTLNRVCQVGGGQCPCKPNYDGLNCDRCAYGYYNFPECKPCSCDPFGAISPNSCDQGDGHCSCKPNYMGRDCGQCAHGYFNYPSCNLCNCDVTGSKEEICDADTGYCLCKENFGGHTCEQCAVGFYRYPRCMECGCNPHGSQGNSCDDYGQCICKMNFAGRTCDRCAPGYYRYPECLSCDCDIHGSYGQTCDQETGQCTCRHTFEGLRCDRCKPNYYNYPLCEECSCNPAGAKQVPGYPLGGCGRYNDGRLCECKENVDGRICDTCKPGYWNLDRLNPLGCEACNCHVAGTVGGSPVCSVSDGQCRCKPYVGGRRCDQCLDGYYNLQSNNVFGCQPCDCDVGGSRDNACDKVTGDCNCLPRVSGRKCDKPLAQHFFPTLYQMQYEMEDGRTARGGAVRYGFDQDVFPNYSWRGYAIYSHIQDEVQVAVDVNKASLYRIVFYYHNPGFNNINADVTVTPERSTEATQSGNIILPPTSRPEHQSVLNTFVLNSGRWTISLKTPDRLYVDYVVLLPQHYYEATILQEMVNNPCMVPLTNGLCKHYAYVDVTSYPSVRAENAYVRIGTERQNVQLYPEQRICDDLGVPNLAYMNPNQRTIFLNLPLPGRGKYVLIIQYHSRRDSRQQVTVDVASPDARDTGNVYFPYCPYSSLCRQAVVDSSNNIKVFDINGAYASLTLTGVADIDLAIDSVIAIPVHEWSIGFIQPKFQCVYKDKKCIDSTYGTPPGSLRIEIEKGNEHRIATDLPPLITDLNIRAVKLDGDAPSITIRSTVTNPGDYVFMAHYYQPHYVGFGVDVEVLVDNKQYKGHFIAEFCPNPAGCRSTVTFPGQTDKMTIELTDLDFLVSINNTQNRPVWLDYIQVIPAQQYRKEYTEVQDVDKSVEFINKCGQDHFYINTSATGFCRDSVFSMTTDYNNGARTCDCNLEGSLSFRCDEFGGQCKCKQHVIGRTCSQCQTGYYGFPNCRKCNCPSQLCDSITGQCVCPPKVTGPDCNICLPETFGFDPLIGCEECNCEPAGVIHNRLDCEATTGQCSCKPHVAGRRCDQCEAGYYSYPRCMPCSCDTRGTTEAICDQRSAECLCKENVLGLQCSECAPSTFYLEERNPSGCTQCFCFGFTSRCRSSDLRRDTVNEMRGWGITNLKMPEIYQRGQTIEAIVQPTDIVDSNAAIYWVAPLDYLGNKVTSYGGKLRYTVKFRIPANRSPAGVVDSDVRIEGNNFTLVYTSNEQPVNGVPLEVEVDMLENHFIHEQSGAPVSREQFLITLSQLDALHIRASYYSAVSQVSLSDVSLDIATPHGQGEIAQNVEQCECPPNYKGTSCEQCADGFYRSSSGPYLGSCVPCQCNGKAERCDPDTGECLNCRDNFSGPQCIACMPGHYHDTITDRCVSCSCPLSIPSNNFARSCSVNAWGQVDMCDCLPGYVGRHCERCDYGYWGNPEQIGSRCMPCDCSGNIDIYDPQSCDLMTGQCLKCINNTAGERCERCADWYYGDAIDLKDCKPCDCDRTGSEMCDHKTGSCLCKPNVVGQRCDQCAPGTFGFHNGHGCEVCNCARASYGTDCDKITGQCHCREGVTGRRCDHCEQGYWNYQSTGCTKCQCEYEGAVTCDPIDGSCQCLPGVTGAKCDRCLPRWVMIPQQGCQECDSCIHLLLDETDIMEYNLTEMIHELDSVSVGVNTLRRLNRINSTVYELRPLVDRIVADPSDPDLLKGLIDDLVELQDMSDNNRDDADRTVRNSEVAVANAADTLKDAQELRRFVQEGIDAANGAVRFAQEVLKDIRSSIDTANIDLLLRQAELILEEIKARDFTNRKDNADVELSEADELRKRVKDLEDIINDQEKRLRGDEARVDDVRDKLRELRNYSRHSIDNAQAAQTVNIRDRKLMEDIRDKLARIEAGEKVARDVLAIAEDFLKSSREFLDDARIAYESIEMELTRLDQAMNNLMDRVVFLSGENKGLRPLVDNATEHAYKLRQQADYLKKIASIDVSADNALKIIDAYKGIVKAIDEADDFSSDAVEKAHEALIDTEGLAERARKALEISRDLNLNAITLDRTVEHDLVPRRDDAMDYTMTVTDLQEQVDIELSKLLDGLDALPEGFTTEADSAVDRAEEARQKAENASSRIENIIARLPKDRTTVIELETVIRSTNIDINTALNQVDDVRTIVRESDEYMHNLNITAERVLTLGFKVQGDLSELRRKISVARLQASLIKVGMTFNQDTTLQVRNPKNLQQAGSYNELSIFFRTQEPNGFLAYIGPDVTSVQSETDYMALEIVDGKVVFTYDLGVGRPMRITNPEPVNDGKWHEVIVQRTGKSAILKVRSPDEPKETEVSGTAEGSFAVFDLNRNLDNTKFYIGGVPASAGLQDRLRETKFYGCIEDVKFDQVPIGLWDFVYGENLKGCSARDELIGVDTNGFKFDGNGYLILEKGTTTNVKEYSKVQFDFKTFSEDGLMFLMGDDEGGTDFFAVEMVGGKVKLIYNLGSGAGSVVSQQSFNDGKWHTLSAERYKKQGLLKVDGTTIDGLASGGIHKHLETNNKLYIGGFPGKHWFKDVTNKGFEGCIQNFYLGPNPRNMNDNIEANGVLPGCPQIARVISFSREVPNSYIEMERVSVDRDFEMTFKIKTEEPEGLLFYVTDDTTDQNDAFSVSVVDGKISVTGSVEDRRTTLETNMNKYNDGAWHYITVTKRSKDLQLHVDDTEMVKTTIEGKRRIKTTTPLYFGGVPPGYSIVPANVGTETHFVGCIGDVTVNGKFINFASAPLTHQRGVLLGSCPLVDPTPAPPSELPFPPFTIPTGVPKPDIKCALPAEPEPPAADAVASGTRFGLHPHSRIEYNTLPDDIKTSVEFSIDFRTTYEDGIIFYVDDERHSDFMALYMKGGKLVFGYNCGSGVVTIPTNNFYNDGHWHTAFFTRENTDGRLLLDGGVEDVRGVSPGNSKSIDVVVPFYIGGVDLETATFATDNIQEVTNSFIGCLRNFLQNGKDVGEPDQEFNTKKCYDNVENGAFFYADGGYLMQQDNFHVGLDFNLTLQMRPRSADGVILSIYGKQRDYLIMQLVNGELRFAVENGGGEIEAVYTSPFPNGLCDGGWHTVAAVKAKNLIRLSVDGVFIDDVTGTEGVSSTDTNDPIYIGGVPERHRGIKTLGQYVGCIRDLVINGESQSMATAEISGHVDLNFCPQN